VPTTRAANIWDRFLAFFGPLNLVMMVVGIPLDGLLVTRLGRIVPKRLRPPYGTRHDPSIAGLAALSDCGWITVGILLIVAVAAMSCAGLFR
jgi:hypothetical protein